MKKVLLLHFAMKKHVIVTFYNENHMYVPVHNL